MNAGKKIFGFVLITLVLLEVTLRLTGWLNTYSENTGHGYTSGYNIVVNSWFPFWKPGDVTEVNQGDFKYTYHINKYGFRDTLPKPEKQGEQKRILVIGDSFAEGMGTTADSAWPKVLQKQLTCSHVAVEVINAGIAGSDPFYEVLLLKHKLMELNPDYVIVAINSTDIDDVIMRGGAERFHKDSTTHYKKGPWYEPLYKGSHIVRLFCSLVLNQPLVGIFLSNKQYAEESRRAGTEIFALLKNLQEQLKIQGVTLVTIVHPVPFEAAHPNTDVSYHPKPIMKELAASLISHNIVTIDLYQHFENLFATQPVLNYAHRNDGHYNGKGYYSFAGAVKDSLCSRKVIH